LWKKHAGGKAVCSRDHRPGLSWRGSTLHCAAGHVILSNGFASACTYSTKKFLSFSYRDNSPIVVGFLIAAPEMHKGRPLTQRLRLDAICLSGANTDFIMEGDRRKAAPVMAKEPILQQETEEVDQRKRSNRPKKPNQLANRDSRTDWKGAQDKKLRRNLKSLADRYQDAAQKAKDADVLLENSPGMLGLLGWATQSLTQSDQASSSRKMNLSGHIACDRTRYRATLRWTRLRRGLN
jgi:hypothetical protein